MKIFSLGNILAFFRQPDNLEIICTAQSDIVAIQAEAQELVESAVLDIELATDAEIDNIRATVNAAFSRLAALVGTGAVVADRLKALNESRKQIEVALTKLDAAI